MDEPLVERLILVIEENQEQVHWIRSAFEQEYQVAAIADGTQVMNFLHRRGEFAQAQRPDLILLDLNLSSKDGREILEELKSSPQLRRIPVVILTHSDREEDIFKSYAQQGNSYVIKSSDRSQLDQIVQKIKDFWLGIVTLPSE